MKRACPLVIRTFSPTLPGTTGVEDAVCEMGGGPARLESLEDRTLLSADGSMAFTEPVDQMVTSATDAASVGVTEQQ
jgi:hypothetical protein